MGKTRQSQGQRHYTEIRGMKAICTWDSETQPFLPEDWPWALPSILDIGKLSTENLLSSGSKTYGV